MRKPNIIIKNIFNTSACNTHATKAGKMSLMELSPIIFGDIERLIAYLRSKGLLAKTGIIFSAPTQGNQINVHPHNNQNMLQMYGYSFTGDSKD